MDLIDKKLREDYDRWSQLIGVDPYQGQKTLGILDVLRAHYLIIDFFSSEYGEGVGGVGPKDLNLLHSTLNRQLSCYEGNVKWKNDLEICATLFWGLVKNHAFHDVNKRTAVLSLFYHLLKNKRYPNAPHKVFEQLAINVAKNNLNFYPQYSKFGGKPDAEVLFLAFYLNRTTRKLEKTEFKITYRQLDNIIRKKKYCLINPDGNQIELIKMIEEPAGLLGNRTITREKRIASIGFPGWTRQVNVNAIKQVRKLTGMTAENGYDSESFYHDAESLPFLIEEFQSLLQRLSDK